MELSPKELQVLTLVALGYSDKEVSVQLKLGYGTVRTYLDRIILKLSAKNRTHAVFLATSKKLIDYCFETLK